MKKAEDKLLVLVNESGLEKTKAQVLLDNFSDHFKIAAEWEAKAKAIIVTNANQMAEMQMARVGRLFLKEKRVAIEKTRKKLKEQSLREGKAIDGIANVLKALIVPIEEHLGKQEKFVEIKEAEEAERKRIEVEKRIEDERIAKEKAEEEERVRVREENERLKKEAKEGELEREKERTEASRALTALEVKARKEREAGETEREKLAHEKRLSEEKLKKEKEAKEEAEKKLKLEKERAEAEKAKMIKCPFCHKSFKLEKK